MITSQDKQFISRLIKKYAGNISTESMIAFVADTNGMLAVCKTLVNSNNNDDQFTISWVDEQCHNRKVDVRGFLYEVEQILSIFQPGHKIDEHYATLQLDDGASDEEIKLAYRQLSRKYHPDTASSDDPGNGDMFIRITKAYHALMEGGNGNASIAPSTPSVNHWREQKKHHHVSSERKKKNLFWFAALALIMIVISLIVGKNYKEKVMIAGLQSSRAAFIPPASSVQSTEQTTELFEPEIESMQDAEKENGPITEVRESPLTTSEEIIVVIEQTPSPPVPQTVEKRPASVPDTVVPVKQTIPEKQTVKKEKPVEKKAPVKIVTAKPEEALPKKEKPILQSPERLSVKKETTVAVAKKEPVASTEAEEQAHMQQKIDEFLANYTQSYKDKDLLAFTRFFDLRATENGRPLAEILPTYSDFFQTSESISLAISILMSEKNKIIIQLDGRFRINILYKSGEKVQGAGVISFLLIDTEKQLSIKEMKYQFDK